MQGKTLQTSGEVVSDLGSLRCFVFFTLCLVSYKADITNSWNIIFSSSIKYTLKMFIGSCLLSHALPIHLCRHAVTKAPSSKKQCVTLFFTIIILLLNEQCGMWRSHVFEVINCSVVFFFHVRTIDVSFVIQTACFRFSFKINFVSLYHSCMMFILKQ